MIRTAVIGMGRMGRRHLRVVQGMQLEVVGVSDRSIDALRMAQQECDLPPQILFDDAHTMLVRTNPELVIVATYATSHAEYVCLAAEQKARFILCEKPMAVSLAQCDAMLDACRIHGVCLAVNHQMRFMEQYTEPKRIVNSKEFGGISSVTVVAGNFGMAMNGTHYFEMFRFLTDELPHEITAWFSPGRLANPRGAQFEDRSGAVRVTTARGKRFYMEIGDDQGHGMQVTYSGPYGRLTVDEFAGSMHLAVRTPEHRSQPTTRYAMPGTESVVKIKPADAVEPTRAVLQELLDQRDYPTGQDGRLAVAVLVAAYVSDENHHIPVTLHPQYLPLRREFPWA